MIVAADHPDHGSWDPLSVDELAHVFSRAPFRWWVAGGLALELHIGTRWRVHADADVGLVRTEAPLAHEYLGEWKLWVAAAGHLRPWRVEPLRAELDENNVWAHQVGEEDWAFDLAVGSGTAHHWAYRRDESVRRPWDRAILTTEEGIPYLAPDLQLLFKSKNPRPKDDQDARVVASGLTTEEHLFLDSHLSPGHPWRALLVTPPASSR